MKTVNSFGLCFAVSPRKAGDVDLGIYARIAVNKTRCEISLKQFVRADEWDARKGKLKAKNERLWKLTAFLESVRAKVYDHYRRLEQEGTILTAAVLKNAFLGLDDAAQQRTMTQVFKEHNDAMASLVSFGTMKNYYATEKYVGKFMKARFAGGDVFIKQLNYSFIQFFDLQHSHRYLPHKMGVFPVFYSYLPRIV